MRGYGRDYDDQQRYLSGGSEIYRDRARHNPSWEDEAYGNRGYGSGNQGGGYQGGGYGGGSFGGNRSQGGDNWRSRSYIAGEGNGSSVGNGRSGNYGRDYNDYGQGDYTYGDFSRQQPMNNRGGGNYDRDMGAQGRDVFQRNRGHSGAGGYGMSRGTGYGAGTGMGGFSGGPFGNPTDRGDYFLGYGGASRRGYSPFW
jgi:hypothetical protein